MKNIHLIPTDKSSRLIYSKVKTEDKIEYKLILQADTKVCNDGLLSGNQNIYITSDEEIKERDWCLSTDKNFIIKLVNLPAFSCDKKIILTTDTDLIADGVQAIDDEFLEWFVKNPSCEFVEWDKNYNRGNGKYYYKIIIPQEEPKQLIGEKVMPLDNDNIEEEEETLEEFINEHTKYLANTPYKDAIKQAMTEGGNWQQERMYSEKDMIEFAAWCLLQDITSRGEGNYVNAHGKILTVKDLLEQFKKK